MSDMPELDLNLFDEINLDSIEEGPVSLPAGTFGGNMRLSTKSGKSKEGKDYTRINVVITVVEVLECADPLCPAPGVVAEFGYSLPNGAEWLVKTIKPVIKAIGVSNVKEAITMMLDPSFPGVDVVAKIGTSKNGYPTINQLVPVM